MNTHSVKTTLRCLSKMKVVQEASRERLQLHYSDLQCINDWALSNILPSVQHTEKNHRKQKTLKNKTQHLEE